MDQSQRTIGRQVASVVRAFEKRLTTRGRRWVAVFLNEDTIAIALHGSLTAAEIARVRSPAGAARVLEFHRRLFATGTAALRRRIKSITGMDVRGVVAAEIEPATGSVAQVFTTDTTAEEFVRTLAGPAGSVCRTVDKTGRATRDTRPRLAAMGSR